MLNQFVKNSFTQNYKATVGVDILSRQIKIEDKSVQLILWDTAGQERTKTFTANFYHDTEGCILVFDLTNKLSFEEVDFWRKEFLNKLQPPEGDDYPFIVIGNKCDIENIPFVKEKDIKEYCSSHYNIPYFLCSAKTADNVDDAFTKIAELALNRVNKKKITISEEVKFIKIDSEKEKKKKQEESNDQKNNKFCCL